MNLKSLIKPMVFGLAAGVTAQAAPGAPTNVTAVAWPYTALISFTPPVNADGAPTTNYTVAASDAGWIAGSGPTSPIMVEGGNELWGGTSHTFTVTATSSAGTSVTSAPSNAVVPSGGSSANVYYNGMFYWAGDYSYGGTVVWADTTGHPENSPYDVMFISGGGGWQPYSPGNNFNTGAYLYLEMDLKPVSASFKNWWVGFANVGDKPCGSEVTLPKDANGTYGPTPVAGKWATYKIPLKNMNVGPGTVNINIYKFAVTTASAGNEGNWYVNNVRFLSDSSTEINQVVPVAPVKRSMTASVNGRLISFGLKSSGVITMYDVEGNQLARMHTTGADVSWKAMSSGAYLARFSGAGAVETQKILVR